MSFISDMVVVSALPFIVTALASDRIYDLPKVCLAWAGYTLLCVVLSLTEGLTTPDSAMGWLILFLIPAALAQVGTLSGYVLGQAVRRFTGKNAKRPDDK